MGNRYLFNQPVQKNSPSYERLKRFARGAGSVLEFVDAVHSYFASLHTHVALCV